MNTYVETVSNRADSLHLAIERTGIKDIMDSMFSRIMAITRPFNFFYEKGLVDNDLNPLDDINFMLS
jgi:hypothetical protein